MKSRPLLALGGAALLYAFIEPWRLDIRRFDVHLENLPAEAENLRVLQISDLHAGAIMPRALLRRILAACRDENPDLIALTGDLVSRRDSYSRFTFARYWASPIMEYAAQVAREIGALHPRLGIWAVPGNHDLWNGSFAPVADVLAASGIETLRNRAIRLKNGLVVAGLDDLRAGYPDFRSAFAGTEADEAQLILNHNPRAAMLLSTRNALILSGHTHAGQVRLRGSQMRAFPVDLGRSFYLDGFYNLERAQLYVSRGAGTVHLPMRFGARPEIAVFTLKRAQKGRETGFHRHFWRASR
ncbi:MAG: metallophosphoesterase [Armatimonadetes bacterium]|nr:metallophosphoesterase [Armatimonadota bacterium]